MKKRFRPVLKIMITTSCVTVEEKKEEKIVGDQDNQDNALKHLRTFLSPYRSILGGLKPEELQRTHSLFSQPSNSAWSTGRVVVLILSDFLFRRLHPDPKTFSKGK